LTSLSADKLQEGLRTKRFGLRVFFSREVGSTNEWARELATFDAGEGTVAIAETQTAGHGRLGREWVSPKGGLWFSTILRPRLKAAEALRLVFVAGLAVAEALRELYRLKVETKWPNDVLVDGRKVCGVLAEMNTTGEDVNFVVLGIGVNADFDVRRALPEELRDSATSLMSELGRKVGLEELFRSLLERLEVTYDSFLKEGSAYVIAKWKKHASFLGRQVEVAGETKLVGLALDVDQKGALVLRLDDGTLKRVLVGDLSLRTK
jgi:BirA family biotin operon repressor/biotin-[acetyl-CoA-carboxylase] ligase